MANRVAEYYGMRIILWRVYSSIDPVIVVAVFYEQ